MATKSIIYKIHLKRPDLPQYRRKYPTYVSAVSRKRVTFVDKPKSSLRPTKKSFFQKRSEYLSKKTAVVSSISGFAKLLGYLFLFLLFASITRKLNDGSIPSFTSLLAYLTTFDLPTIPFRNTNGLVLGFLEFIFSNAIQGFYVFLKIISFMFFG